MRLHVYGPGGVLDPQVQVEPVPEVVKRIEIRGRSMRADDPAWGDSVVLVCWSDGRVTWEDL